MGEDMSHSEDLSDVFCVPSPGNLSMRESSWTLILLGKEVAATAQAALGMVEAVDPTLRMNGSEAWFSLF